MAQDGTVRYDTIRYDMARHDKIWYDMVRYGTSGATSAKNDDIDDPDKIVATLVFD